MKFPYIMGERSPGRAAEEYYLKRKDSSFARKTFYQFSVYLERYYPYVKRCLDSIWFIDCFILDWPTKQSPFAIVICDLRSGTVLAIYPTFKKVARALALIFKQVKFLLEEENNG